jgi:endogenous inhibitor of DNA gyrase (YacG/DUF329 family)
MPMLKVQCPKCRDPVATGIAMSRDSLSSAELEDNETQCPNCKTRFKWSKRDIDAEASFPH